MKQLFACLVISAVAACSTNGSSTQIDSTPLAGTVGGQPWTFVVGATDAFLSQDQTDFFAVFYPTSYTPCTGIEPSGPHLIVSVPKQPGDYTMDLQRNMTFVDSADHNFIATDGRVVVDSVTATSVTGGLVGTFDGSNDVSGQFTLTVCPN